MHFIRHRLSLIALFCVATQLSSAPPTGKDKILLANCANQTGDGMLDRVFDQPLRTALEESPFLSVLPGAGVATALAGMGHPAHAPLTPELARQVCQRLHGPAYITGTLNHRKRQFVITLGAVDCEGDQPLARVQSSAPSRDKILDALGDTVGKLRLQLGESRESVQEFSTPLSRATSASYEALQDWSAALRAQQESSDVAEGSQAALPLLEKALRVDPNFASALFTVGLIYRDALQEARARDYLIRAFRLGERASVREKYRNAGLYYSFVTVDTTKQWPHTRNGLSPIRGMSGPFRTSAPSMETSAATRRPLHNSGEHGR